GKRRGVFLLNSFLGFLVWGFWFGVSGLGFLVSGFWFRVSGFGFLVLGFGFWVWGFYNVLNLLPL
ncbi:MAG: hypothetical protein ACPG7E_03995, partial [Marinirhabdus sp.]